MGVFWIQISRTKVLTVGNNVDVTDGLHMVLRPRLRGIFGVSNKDNGNTVLYKEYAMIQSKVSPQIFAFIIL